MEIGALSRSLSKHHATFDEVLSYLRSCITSAESGSNKVDFLDFGFSLSADEVVELIGFLYENYLKDGQTKDKQKQRDHGIYFTNRALSDLISKDAQRNVFPTATLGNRGDHIQIKLTHRICNMASGH